MLWGSGCTRAGSLGCRPASLRYYWLGGSPLRADQFFHSF